VFFSYRVPPSREKLFSNPHACAAIEDIQFLQVSVPFGHGFFALLLQLRFFFNRRLRLFGFGIVKRVYWCLCILGGLLLPSLVFVIRVIFISCHKLFFYSCPKNKAKLQGLHQKSKSLFLQFIRRIQQSMAFAITAA
jgi:hypothetical protein